MSASHFLFCDLDDTLFQSRRKTPSMDGVSTAARGPDGQPNGFMTPAQRRVLDTLNSWATLIPVTARDLDAYTRVHLPPAPFAVLDHGGLILENGTPMPAWAAHMRQQLAPAVPLLDQLHALAQGVIASEGLACTSRIIGDQGQPFYWLSKYRDEQAAHLDRMLEAVALPWVDARRGQWWVHRNGNNLAVLPSALQKKHAVAFLLERLRATHPELVTWGMGDSHSDVPFMQLCDYLISPAGSQLTAQLGLEAA